eukprot:maker-scaffold_28-snap-gene-0.31-mRNA-1 protein AED:0.25 eAED:0.25 QI:34/0/0.5/1/0/0.5/2/0/250
MNSDNKKLGMLYFYTQLPSILTLAGKYSSGYEETTPNLSHLTTKLQRFPVSVLKVENLNKKQIEKYFDKITEIIQLCGNVESIWFDKTISHPKTLLTILSLFTLKCKDIKSIQFREIKLNLFKENTAKDFFDCINKFSYLEEIEFFVLNCSRRKNMKEFKNQLVGNFTVDQMENLSTLRIPSLSGVFHSMSKYSASVLSNLSLVEFYICGEVDLIELNKFVNSVALNNKQEYNFKLRAKFPQADIKGTEL